MMRALLRFGRTRGAAAVEVKHAPVIPRHSPSGHRRRSSLGRLLQRNNNNDDDDDDDKVDAYAWLQSAPESAWSALIENEEKFARRRLWSSDEFRQLAAQVESELRAGVVPEDETLPEKFGRHYYTLKALAGHDLSVYSRRASLDDGAGEEELLNIQQLIERHGYVSISQLRMSPDETMLAYGLDSVGNERYTLYMKRVPPGGPQQLLDDRVDNVVSFDWNADGTAVYYTRADATGRPYAVYRHRVGTPAAADVKLYEELDPTFAVNVALSKDNRFIIVSSASRSSSEVRVLPATDDDNDGERMQLFKPRQSGVRYFVDAFHEYFVVIQSTDADSFDILRLPVDAALRGHAASLPLEQLLPPPSDGARVVDVDLFASALVTTERLAGRPRLRLHRYLGDGRFDSRVINVPGVTDDAHAAVKFSPGLNGFHASHYRLGVAGPLIEPAVFEVPLNGSDDQPSERFVDAVHVQHDNAARCYADFPYQDYCTRWLHVRNDVDGAEVPVVLVHRKGLAMDHSSPLLVRAYGAYGSVLDPDFVSLYVSLLRRGFVIAHLLVRGGGELGPHWHAQGKLANKLNTFTDCTACVQRLVDLGYSQPARVGAVGTSAGGLTLAAAINMRPDLFRAAVLEVPFVDVLSAMSQPDLPLTASEYGEWGNPSDPAVRKYIAAYDPYLNIPASPASFPSLLVSAGTEDIRVPAWIPAKYVARLRHTLPQHMADEIFLNIQPVGHNSGGRYSGIQDSAFTAAFLISRLTSSS